MLKKSAIVIVVLLFIWQGLVMVFHVPIYLLPSPLNVAHAVVHNFPLLMQQAWPTVLEAIFGLLLAVAWGMCAAIGMHFSKTIRFGLLPMLLLSQALPTLAIAPLLVVWLGYGMASKIAVGVIALFFPVTTAFYDGLKRVPGHYLDAAHTLRAKAHLSFWHVSLPAALPALGSGITMAAAWAPMAAIVGEWVGASRGLGFLILQANAKMDMPLMFAALFVLVVFSMLLYFGVSTAVRKVIFW
jgi:putative hydroxymethylpyrimidine transport system permease protein